MTTARGRETRMRDHRHALVLAATFQHCAALSLSGGTASIPTFGAALGFNWFF